MRILRLDLQAFGPFTNQTLDLAGGDFGLHIVFGLNEAGKSSALRALRSFFYGIGPRSSDNFLHPYPKMRVGATLQTSDGQVHQWIRRKGNRNTLRDASDEQPVEEATLASLLGGVDEVSFARRYGLGYDDLVQGGREIVAGGGDLGQSLFAAASGIANLHAMQAELAEESKALFLDKGRNPTINDALRQYKQLQDQIKECLLPTARWREHDAALKDGLKQRESIRRKISNKVSRQKVLQRIADATPVVAKRKLALDDLAPLSDAPLLAEGFPEQRREAATSRDIAVRAIKTEEEKCLELHEAIKQAQPIGTVLQHASAIAQLREALGSHRKAMDDRRLRVAEKKTEQQAATTALKELGRADLDIGKAEQLRLTAIQRVRIQDLGNEKSRLLERVKNAHAHLAQLDEQREDIARRQNEADTPRDPQKLLAAVAAARDAGPIERTLSELQTQHQEDSEQAERDLARLQGFAGDLAALERSALPADETVDRLEQQLGQRQEQLKTSSNTLAEHRDEARRLDEKLEHFRQGQDVPSEDDLLAARKIRDDGWELVRARLTDAAMHSGDAQAYLRQFDNATELEDAYAQAVAQADYISDRLRREADQVAKKSEIVAQRKTLHKRIASLTEQQTQAAEQLADCEHEWASAWVPLGLSPLSPREMRPWLRQARELCETAATGRKRQDQITRWQQEVATYRRAIAAALAEFDETTPEDDTLSACIRHGAAVASEIQEQRRNAEQLQREERQLARELEHSRRASDDAAKELSEWAEQWQEAIAPLRLREGAEPAEANAASEGTKQLLEHLDAAQALEQRIDGIDRDAEQFQREVQAICEAAAPSLVGQTAENAVAELAELLATSQETQTRQTELKKQLDTAQKRLANARRDGAAADSLLETLCGEAGCQSPEQLPEAERASRRRRDLERLLQELNDRLIELAEGQPLEEFIESLAEHDTESLGEELNTLANEIDELREEDSRLGEEIGRQRTLYDSMDGGAKAAETHQRSEQLLAKIEAEAQQYARLRLASVVLQRAIERYRQRHQAPVLERASALFATLTLGRFEALRADLDDAGSPILVGVRGGEVVHVDGMSAGTCDQLYLALRLASLETDLESREPLPLIVDDVLIKFDDDRSAAALQALAATSKRTQVIMFTHHEHVVRLAQETLDDDVLFTHKLNRGQAS